MILSSTNEGPITMTKHFKLGNSRIPLGLPDKWFKDSTTGLMTRMDSFRSSNLENQDLIEASNYVQHGIKHSADIYETSIIPSRAKGRTLTVANGLRTHQISIQPKKERGWFKDGVWRENDDWLLMYDMDKLSGLPLPGSTEMPFVVALNKFKRLRDEGRAFVWTSLSGAPKAAFWMRGRKTNEECVEFLKMIHQEVFDGEDSCAPATDPQDMYSTYITHVGIAGELAEYFAEVDFQNTQTMYRLREEGRLEELRAVFNPIQSNLSNPSTGSDPAEEMGTSSKDQKREKDGLRPSWNISGTIGNESDETDPYAAAFNELIAKESESVLAHGFTPNYPDVLIPKSLMGRKHSAVKELILRFVISMPYRLLHGEGVAIPCTVIQRELCRLGISKMRFNDDGSLDCSTAAKATKDLVARGVLAYAEPDETKRYKAHQRATVYLAVHPELVALAEKHLEKTVKQDFKNRTAEQAAKRYFELTGKRVEDIQLDGCSWTAIRPLTNYCPSLKVFTELCMLIPGFSSKADRVARLEPLWRKHEKNLKRRKLLANVEELAEVA